MAEFFAGSVQTESYHSAMRILGDGVIRTDRTQIYSKPVQVDAFGPHWCVGYIQKPDHEFAIRAGENWKSLEGPTLIFLPPFSIFEAQVPPSVVTRWTIYTGIDEGSSSFPRAWIPGPDHPPESLDELRHWQAVAFQHGHAIDEGRELSAIAERLKRWLDLNFRSQCEIGQAAAEFGYSRVVLGRAFKRCYGLSAIQYRHRLRLFTALAEMNKGASITEAIAAVGFSDPSQFIIQFKNYLGVTPKDYVLRSFEQSVRPQGRSDESRSLQR